jgi:anti-sigma-K factor RskA
MRETHIIRMLEEKPISSLSEGEMANAESHIAQCSECKRAYDAARVSSALILARASVATEVGPFFKTRVMAALRERHLSPEVPALVRMWRAAGTLASTMAALLVILVALTVFDSRMQSPAVALSQNIYSPEYVVFEQGDLDDDDLAYDEVVATMYELEDADGQ